MTQVRTTEPLPWQVEPIRDELQEAIDTYVKLRRAMDAVSRYVETELNQWGVTTAQYGILLHLMKGPRSLTDLSGLIFRSNSTLTSLIDRMERDGLVVRGAHSNDRRVTIVELTDKGRKKLVEIRARHRPFLAEMMSCLSVGERAQLFELLDKIERKIENADSKPQEEQ